MRYSYTRQNVQTGQDDIFNPICIEYKSPKWEESPHVWRRAKTQLTEYMVGVHAPLLGQGTAFAAVVIGRWIRFYTVGIEHGV